PPGWRLVRDDDQGSLLEQFFPLRCDPSELCTSGAKSMLQWIDRGEHCGARLLWCRKQEEADREVIALEVEVPLGQRTTVHPIERYEPIAFIFGDGIVPCAYPIRVGFPFELPHINLAVDQHPKSLCLFDLDPDEIRRILSPALLLERTKWWLCEAAYGRLHGPDQPLDPIFGGYAVPLLFLSPQAQHDGAALAGFRRADTADAPILVDLEDRMQHDQAGNKGLTVLNLVTAPVSHGRIRSLPRTVGQLLEVYRDLGVDLLALLQERFRAWCVAGSYEAKFRKAGILIISTPLLREEGVIDGISRKAFAFGETMGDLAEATGVLGREGDGIGPLIGPPVSSEEALAQIQIDPATVYDAFDRKLAAVASGAEPTDEPMKVLLVGCGALGSQLALAAARSGHGQWTCVDPDHLLPHNLARHQLSPQYLGAPKVEGLAHSICGLLGDGSAVGHPTTIQDYLKYPSNGDSAELLIDTSASVPVSRELAANKHLKTPIVSAFLNPTGTDLVVMREGEERNARLDHLEMDYYWHLVTNESLHNHLSVAGEFMPAGGCRHPSAVISQADVMRAAGEATNEIFGRDGLASGMVAIHASTGDIRATTRLAGNYYTECNVAGWTIAICARVLSSVQRARAEAEPNETGGIVVGAWDRRIRKGYLVALLDPPPDSVQSPTGFVRGAVGVFHELEAIGHATAQNLNYVGEWHTHPPKVQSTPSSDDRLLMQWIDDEVTMSDVPAIMLIGGEDGVRLCVGTTFENCVIGHSEATTKPNSVPDRGAA
ncbi:ThiF family adenylyltransferase, partial [Erythrobacter sp. HI0019]